MQDKNIYEINGKTYDIDVKVINQRQEIYLIPRYK